MPGRSQKSREGGAAVLLDTARIRKGVLEPCACLGLERGAGTACTAAPYPLYSILHHCMLHIGHQNVVQ